MPTRATVQELSPTQVAQYQALGFLVIEKVIPNANLLELRRVARDLPNKAGPLSRHNPRLNLEPVPLGTPSRLRKIEPIVDLSTELLSLSQDTRLTTIAAQLLGCTGVILFEDKLNYKAAEVGSSFPLHQDYAYWTNFSDQLVTLMLYLERATEENGCVRFVPGSHHHGLLPTVSGIEPYIAPEGNPHETTGAPAPAGSVVAFSGYTIHHSMCNRSAFPRTSILFTYNPIEEGDGYPLYTGKRRDLCKQWITAYNEAVRKKRAKLSSGDAESPPE